MKLFPHSALLADLGVNVVENYVIRMGFVWRPIPRSDVGLDGWIELCDSSTRQVLGQQIGVQVKSTRRRFPGESETHFHWPCRAHDVSYWLETNLPVILVVVRPAAEGNEAYWVDVKQYFARVGVSRSPKVRFEKSRDRFDEKSGAALHEVVASVPHLPPPHGVDQPGAPSHCRGEMRHDLRWPGYGRATWWFVRRMVMLLLLRERLERQNWVRTFMRLRCLDYVDRERIREPVLAHVRCLSEVAFEEGIRSLSIHLTAALMSILLAIRCAPVVTDFMLGRAGGDSATDAAYLKIGLAMAGILFWAVWLPVYWHRKRRVSFPRWVNVIRLLLAWVFLVIVLSFSTFHPEIPTPGPVWWTVYATTMTCLLSTILYVYLSRWIARMELSPRARAERRRPDAGIVYRLVEVLRLIDHDERPWFGTATRRRLLTLLGETATLFERHMARRLRPSDAFDSKEWKNRCACMAANVRRLTSKVSIPGGATQEELQREVIRILIPAAVGEWNDIPAAPRDGSLWRRT